MTHRLPHSAKPPARISPQRGINMDKTQRQLNSAAAQRTVRRGRCAPAYLVFLCFMLALCLCGCAGTQTGSADAQGSAGGWELYYLNKDLTTIVPVSYTPSDGTKLPDTASSDEEPVNAEEDASAEGVTEMPAEASKQTSASGDEKTFIEKDVVNDMIDQLSSSRERLADVPPIDGFSIKGWKVDKGEMTVDFSKGYNELSSTRRILVRAAFVNTFCQLPEIRSVAFTCEGDTILDGAGSPIAASTPEQYIFNSGNEIRGYEKVRLHLYFANQKGDRLVNTYRNVVYNSNIAMERLVTEQVLKGPNSKVVFPTLNADTKVLSVTTRDSVCYVNLDRDFLTEPYNVTPQVAVYSLVNSLTELPSVRRVQISVEGSTSDLFMDTVSLQNAFERDDSIVVGDKDGDSKE